MGCSAAGSVVGRMGRGKYRSGFVVLATGKIRGIPAWVRVATGRWSPGFWSARYPCRILPVCVRKRRSRTTCASASDGGAAGRHVAASRCWCSLPTASETRLNAVAPVYLLAQLAPRAPAGVIDNSRLDLFGDSRDICAEACSVTYDQTDVDYDLIGD